MQTSKKSSKNKPKVVYIYGTIAVGKLTTAEALEKITGFKLIHNHLIINPVSEIFPRDSTKPSRATMIHELYNLITKLSMKDAQDIIMTHAFSYYFVDKNGISDLQLIRKIKNTTEKNGGEFCPVFLYAEKDIIISRSDAESRIKHKKLIEPERVKGILEKYTFKKEVKFKNNLKIDNTKLSAKKVAQMIKQHFEL